MITPIFHNLLNKNINFGNSKVNVMYLNDMHGSLSHIDSFVTARDEFYSEHPDDSNWTVSGGDMFIKGSENNNVVAKFIEKYVDVSAIGNHDISDARDFSRLLKKYDIAHKFLSVNLDADAGSPLDGKIAQSCIVSDGLEEIGYIGISPIEFDKYISKNKNNDFVSVADLKDTIVALKKEVHKLESAGVNKIVLLAHTGQQVEEYKGIDLYKAFAKIGGIDLIVGGHDHLLIDRWEKSSRQCVNNPEKFEPVKIVSTGGTDECYFAGNLNMFGTLKLEFDDNGVLIPRRCHNNVFFTSSFPKTNFISKYIDKKSNRILGVLPEAIDTTSDPLKHENKVANIVADADFYYATKHSKKGKKPDFAFVNAGTIRDSFPDVAVTKNQIQQVLPFSDYLVKAELSKKQIYDALTVCARSTSSHNPSPGLMQVSHMTYKVNPDYSISDVKILDDNGDVKYNLDEMDDNDKFTCVYDSFLISGPNAMKSLKSKPVEEYGVTRVVAFEEYLSSGVELQDYLCDRIIVDANC